MSGDRLFAFRAQGRPLVVAEYTGSLASASA